MSESNAGVMEQQATARPSADRRSGSGNKPDSSSADAVSQATRILEGTAAQRESSEEAVPPGVRNDEPDTEDPGEDPKTEEPAQEVRLSESEIRSIRTEEIQTAGSHLIYREMFKRVDNFRSSGMTEQQIDEVLKADEGAAALMDMYAIENASSGDRKVPYTEIVINGKIITSLTATPDGRFDYKFKASPDADIEVTRGAGDQLLTTDQIVQSIFLAKEAKIAELFPENQRDLIHTDAAIIRNGPDAIAGKSTAELDGMINRASDHAAIPTTESMLAHASRWMSKEEFQELKMITEGHKIPNAEILDKIFDRANFGGKIAETQAEIEYLEKQLRDRPNDESLRENIDVKRGWINKYREWQDQLGQGAAQGFVDRIATGRIDMATARAVQTAMRDGNMEPVITALFKELQEDPKDTIEQAAAKDRIKRERVKQVQTFGWLGLVALIMAGMATGELAKSVSR
jgi:hypothetical protein